MRDLAITTKKIIKTTITVPAQEEGAEDTQREVEVILRAPSVPQSLRIMMSYQMQQHAQEVLMAAVREADDVAAGFFEVDEKGTKTGPKKLSFAESSALMDKMNVISDNIKGAEALLDTKRREFHHACFSFVEAIRSVENKRPVLFNFGWEENKTWAEMNDDDRETMCSYDNTLAIDPIFSCLREGASAEELGK